MGERLDCRICRIRRGAMVQQGKLGGVFVDRGLLRTAMDARRNGHAYSLKRGKGAADASNW